MSECRWTYYDPVGGPQTLGLYHGEESGHVMIYLNEKVLIVDFMVYHSKSYSFMVNEMLVQLNLQKENGRFEYKFEGKRMEPDHSYLQKVMKLIRAPFSS